MPFICEPMGIFMDGVVLSDPVWEGVRKWRFRMIPFDGWCATKVAGRTVCLHWPLKVGEAAVFHHLLRIFVFCR